MPVPATPLGIAADVETYTKKNEYTLRQLQF